MPRSSARPHSPEPWRQDHKDPKTILDAHSRMVAVTTMKEDAERMVAGVNATRGLESPGLGKSSLLAAMQVLYEICQYNADMKFRNHVDRNGGLESLLARADEAWRTYGDECFRKAGLEAEAEAEPVSESFESTVLPEAPALQAHPPRPSAPKTSATPRRRS